MYKMVHRDGGMQSCIKVSFPGTRYSLIGRQDFPRASQNMKFNQAKDEREGETPEKSNEDDSLLK